MNWFEISSKILIHNQKTTRINEIDVLKSEDVHHIDDDKTNSEESVSVLR